MNGWVWGGIIIGVAIVVLAVGIPFFLTHKGMRSPRDVSDSRGYLRTRRRWLWRRRARAASYPETTGSLPAGSRRSAEPAPASADDPLSTAGEQSHSSGKTGE